MAEIAEKEKTVLVDIESDTTFDLIIENSDGKKVRIKAGQTMSGVRLTASNLTYHQKCRVKEKARGQKYPKFTLAAQDQTAPPAQPKK